MEVKFLRRLFCSKYRMWSALYRCKCGVEFTARISDVNKGATKSCGCYRRAYMQKTRTGLSPANKIHGEGSKKSPEYKTWLHLRRRCYDEKDIRYSRYGKRGIKVCERWRYNYKAFLADMGRKPGPEYSIDRIDNDGNYEPKNCRWATRLQQANNHSHARNRADKKPSPCGKLAYKSDARQTDGNAKSTSTEIRH